MNDSSQDPGNNQEKRAEMLGAIGDAMQDEDYDFALEISESQNLIKPSELAEYIDVKRRSSEDPVEQRRWEDGLTKYLGSLAGKRFSVEEIEILDKVKKNLEFDRITGNEDEATEPEMDLSDRSEEYVDVEVDHTWRDDEFMPPELTNEEIEKIKETPIGTAVVEKAEDALNYSNSDHLQSAKDVIESFKFGATNKLRSLLDIYVCRSATEKAEDALNYSNSDHLGTAVEIIEKYASSEEIALLMERSLDKHVFAFAKSKVEDAANYGNTEHIKTAIEIIDQFVSSPERIKSMLDELGLA